MRFFIIGDKATLIGFSLIGVEGIEVNSKTETINALKEALRQKDIGIVLITQKRAREIQPQIDELLGLKNCVLILQIPGFSDILENRRSVEELVLSALGVKV